jgi:hypothetical protein
MASLVRSGVAAGEQGGGGSPAAVMPEHRKMSVFAEDLLRGAEAIR